MFDLMTGIFPIMFLMVFLLFIVVFVMAIVKGIGQANKNNHSPRLDVKAKLVTKRTAYRSDFTHYYLTFEVESKDRLEFNVSGNEYGMLVEGDEGILSFQGTRYLGFVRNR